MTVDSQALWIPSPNYGTGRNGYTPKWLIIHGTAGGTTAQGTADWFANPASQVSAHYSIGQDGTIACSVAEENWAWGNGFLSAGHDSWWNVNINPNWTTISIEHCKPDSLNATALTAAQKAASFGLIARICKRWNIPMRAADANGGITGHYSIDPVNRTNCPGNYPWAELWTYLNTNGATQGDLTMLEIGQGMGTLFTDSGNGRWHCAATNVDLIGANLGFYRRHEGVGGLPLTNELYINNINGKDASGTAVVVFERYIQIYDPNRKVDQPPVPDQVYLLHVNFGWGQAYLAKTLTDSLNAQITKLQAELAAAQTANHEAEVALLTTQVNSYKQAVSVVLTTLQNIK